MTRYALCLDVVAGQSKVAVDFFRGSDIQVLSSFEAMPLEEATAFVDEKATTMQAQWPPGAPSVPKPLTKEELVRVLSTAPLTASQWKLRNVLLMQGMGSVFWVVDDMSLANLDITQHLMMAKALQVASIGLLPAHSRGPIDPTQLTMTDLIAVTEEPRILSLIVATLKGGD